MHGRLVHAGLQAAYEAARDEGAQSGSMMATFYSDAHQAILDYTDQDPIWMRARHDAAAEVDSLLRVLPVPAPGAILAVELPLAVAVEDVTVKIVIDLVLLTGAYSIHIRDWKTGQLPADIGLSPQLGTYHWAARQRWAFATTITVGLYNTRYHEELPGSFTPETASFVMERLVSHYREAVATGEAVRHGRRSIEDSYPPRPGPHCTGCGVRSYCPVFAAVTLPVRDENVVRQEMARIESLINAN